MSKAITIEQHLLSVHDLDEETLNNNKKILQHLKQLGASFVAELAWELSLTEYAIKCSLRDLESKGEIEQISVNPYVPDRRLMARVPDQSARGQGGYHNFCKKRWFGVIA